ncbi:hypothetical protein CDD82_3527 [Ophiocordyceps australis]|uniref:Uncharacterized protein n=1 Tax=Ophiocordyceps australis TaxID=1399860 RepID=A0A2C5ZPV3_9HYPO|nr:hypothetical protein CDD82_3527 [Ophiocordyceps australis]
MDYFSTLPNELRLAVFEHMTRNSDIDNTIHASPAMLETAIHFPLAIRRQRLRTQFPGSLLYTAKAVVFIYQPGNGIASQSPQYKEALLNQIKLQQKKLPDRFDRLDVTVVSRLEKLYQKVSRNIQVFLNPPHRVFNISVDTASAILNYQPYDKIKDDRLEEMHEANRVDYIYDFLSLALMILRSCSSSAIFPLS